MLNTYVCAFFGHRDFSKHLECENRMLQMIKEIVSQHEYVEFLVGREGEFDKYSASMVQRVKKEYDNCSLVWVMPYQKAEYVKNKEEFNRYYDSVEVCEKSEEGHFKASIKIRNYEMVERANVVICYVDRNSGNTFQVINYAKEMGVKVINLYEGE